MYSSIGTFVCREPRNYVPSVTRLHYQETYGEYSSSSHHRTAMGGLCLMIFYYINQLDQ